MSESSDQNQSPEVITDFFLPDEAQIERLRRIIRSETGFKFTYKDTEEVGYQLITLFECLARGRTIIPARQADEQRQ